ncbi:hypothetical protein EWM64_g1696 [Hericium alpestre]|uniref:Uncharacterized protein n=1 Tax=Hericium alpestre TaxID=135208 RepID=A0A4Z0A7S4_9AGAM|nr:hypothetical protein EWM64_g1696 [Hericium alpestre]
MHQQMAQPVPPQHQHSLSQSNIHQQVPLPPPPQHSLTQPNVHQFVNPQMAYHRPIPRVPPPQFLSMESFQMTPQLLAEIDQAHQLGTQGLAYAGAMSTQAPPNLSGLAGVAYAGGASSGAIPKTHFEAGSPPKDHPIMERLKASERVSPKEPENAQRSGATLVRRDTREKEKERDIGRRGSLKRDPPSQLPPALQPSHSQAPPREGSPQYHTPLTTPNEHTAAYTQYERELYAHPGHAEASSPPGVRKVSASSSTSVPAQSDSPALRGTPPTAPKVASQTPPAQTTKTRTPDKSLPVQEEPEEELVEGNAKPVQDSERDRWGPPASNEYMRYDHDMQYEKQLRGLTSQSSPTPSSDLHPEGRPSRYDDRHDHDITGGRDDDDDVEAAEDGRIGQNGHGDE